MVYDQSKAMPLLDNVPFEASILFVEISNISPHAHCCTHTCTQLYTYIHSHIHTRMCAVYI